MQNYVHHHDPPSSTSSINCIFRNSCHLSQPNSKSSTLYGDFRHFISSPAVDSALSGTVSAYDVQFVRRTPTHRCGSGCVSFPRRHHSLHGGSDTISPIPQPRSATLIISTTTPTDGARSIIFISGGRKRAFPQLPTLWIVVGFGGVRNCRSDEIYVKAISSAQECYEIGYKSYNQRSMEGDDVNSNNYDLATPKSLR